MEGLRESQDERLVHRMIFFTDAVFAIVMTLLVLELRPPVGDLLSDRGAALQAMSGHLLAFAITFALAGVFWIAHLSTMRRLEHFDWPVAVANLIFLFPVCLMPFVSSWLGSGAFDGLAWAAYSSVLIVTSLANVVLVLVATRDGGRLMNGVHWRERGYRVTRAASAGLAFGAGLVLLYTGHSVLTVYCWVLIPVVLIVARLAFGESARRADAHT